MIAAIYACTLVAVTLAAAILITNSPAGAYKVFSGPVGTCGSLLEMYAKIDDRVTGMTGGAALVKSIEKIWLAGFLTGIGLVRARQGLSNITENVDLEGAAGWIEK